ncbi:Cloroperoxidase [Hortaea werneckii]|nr:Cloroperoxidase [Hortaea werneckii]KAI6996251.1 Cloroperoxidase [Hortaea werneckii]KAI7146556.1 Cloroperoxidase [Hortaea werneckii]KAI7176858.1 Cloroperoxidase [Hortaea werneckii]
MLILTLALVQGAFAFPWVANVNGVDSSILKSSALLERDTPDCPFNPNHQPAAPVTSKYPYNNAKDGKPGNGKGGYLVPAPGDTAHEFRKPNPKTDIRGPCPGLNAAANHGFLARDGITTYNELVDAQQNLYNVGYDLANLLAIAGVGLDGDLVGTGKLSIGCDATSRTASTGNLLADELGLNGHNHFEADASLTRNDYFLADGDNYRWNATLFTQMLDYCQGNCNLEALSKYREARYYQSVADNGNFFFGPGSLLLYGAASFLYELMPTAGGTADEATMMSFFGADKVNGEYVWNGGERIPPNWRARVEPYDNNKVGIQIIEMYLMNPVLFGGNVGRNNFNGLNFSTYIQDGKLNTDLGDNALCLIYQALTGGFPSQLGQVINLPVALVNAMTAEIAPMAENLGCPLNHNSGSSVSGG